MVRDGDSTANGLVPELLEQCEFTDGNCSCHNETNLNTGRILSMSPFEVAASSTGGLLGLRDFGDEEEHELEEIDGAAHRVDQSTA